MLHQIFCQQMGLLRQRARSSHVAFLQRRTRAVDIVPDLSHRLLLSRIQGASRQLLQLAAGAPSNCSVLWRSRVASAGVMSGAICAAGSLAPPWRTTIFRERRPALARRAGGDFRGSARRVGIRLFLRQALGRVLPRNRSGLRRRLHRWGCDRSRSLPSSLRGAGRFLCASHSCGREAQHKRDREFAGKSHSTVNRIVSHACKERKLGAWAIRIRAQPGSGRTTKSGRRFRLPGCCFGFNAALFGATGIGGCADGFVFRLQDDTIKWGRGHEASANDADPAQRESTVGTALPGTSVVAALEDHAGCVTGGEQALVGGIEADGSDVLGRQAVADVLPSRATVSAAERTFARGDVN